MSNFTLIKVKQSFRYLHIIQFARFFFWFLMFISAPFLSLQPAMALFRCPPAPGSAGSVNLRREQLAWWVTWSLFFHDERENLRLNRFAVQTDHRDKARAAACANLRRSCASCSNLSWCQMTWKKTELMKAERRFCWLARLLVFLCIWRVFLKIGFRPLASACLPLLHLCIMQPPPSFPTKWI